MNIFAHRGITTDDPDNSIGAVTQALRQGFSVEVDLRSTADGKIVLSHDATLSGSDGTSIEIATTNLGTLYDTVATVNDDYTAAERYPMLDRILNLFVAERSPGAELAMHIKDDIRDIGQKLSEAVERANVLAEACDLFNHIFVFDTSIETAHMLADAEPKLRVGLSVAERVVADNDRFPTVYAPEVVWELDCADIIWADEWLGSLYTESFFDGCLTAGLQVMCVSPELHATTSPSHPSARNYQNRWIQINMQQINGLCTDHPAELNQYIHE